MNPGLNPYIYGQLIFNKVANTIHLKRTVFPTSGSGIVVYPYIREKLKSLTPTTEKN